MIEKTGKTMGKKLESSLTKKGRLNVPGPGTYKGEKLRIDDLKFSMGIKMLSFRT